MKTALLILYALGICAVLTQVASGGQQLKPGPRTTAPQETLHELDAELDGLVMYIGTYPPQLKDDAERQNIEAKWSSAVKKFGELLQQYPDDAELEWRVGMLYHMGHNLDIKGAWQNSERHLRRALELDPKSLDALITLGFLYVGTRLEYAPAAEILFKAALALAKDKPLARAHGGLFFAYYYQAKFQDAVREADKYLALQPDDAAAKRLREIAFEQAKKAGQ